MFKRLSNAVLKHPWLLIATWAVLGAAVVAFAPKLSTYTSNNNSSFLPGSYQSVQALEAAERYFPPLAQGSGLIVVSAANGHVLSAADQQRVAGLASSLAHEQIASVSSVSTSPAYLSENGKAQLIQVVFDGQAGDPGPNGAVPVVRERTDATSRAPGCAVS
jgi:putative drug exporter of the RND superfamily